MNRAQRRSTERRLSGIERQRVALEEDLRSQAAAIRAAGPGPGETLDEAIAALDASIADLSGPEWLLVATSAVAELRAYRDDLVARKGLS
jgi:hypothetical protein